MEPKQQLSFVNIFMPIAIVVGGLFGYRFGAHFGIGWGVVGLFGGAILTIPIVGVLMLTVIGALWLIEKFVKKPKGGS